MVEAIRLADRTGSSRGDRQAAVALGMIVTAWIFVLALILRHPVLVSHDSISNYGHVWYVQRRIWHDHQLPWSMPVIGHGKAFAFPYAFIPWISAALLWPMLGSWVVTLWLVVGTVALIAATFWAFPELRGWWAAAALVNPALVVAPIAGELPFIWAAAMLLGGIACWRRQRRFAAVILAGAAQATHPAVVLPMALLLVAWWWQWEPDRGALLKHYGVSVALAVPAAWVVFASPVFADSSGVVIVTSFVGTLAIRALVVVVPILLVVSRRREQVTNTSLRSMPWLAFLMFAVLLGSNLVFLHPLDASYAWGALDRRPDTELVAFIKSTKFVPGATYRLLRVQDGKVGMYQLEQHGARLDSEFFPESIDRHSWASLAKYSAFLRSRSVDYVIVFRNYDRVWRTNEHLLLRDLTQQDIACRPGLVASRRVGGSDDFDVYEIHRRGC